jgi:hypothetical protein
MNIDISFAEAGIAWRAHSALEPTSCRTSHQGLMWWALKVNFSVDLFWFLVNHQWPSTLHHFPMHFLGGSHRNQMLGWDSLMVPPRDIRQALAQERPHTTTGYKVLPLPRFCRRRCWLCWKHRKPERFLRQLRGEGERTLSSYLKAETKVETITEHQL